MIKRILPLKVVALALAISVGMAMLPKRSEAMILIEPLDAVVLILPAADVACVILLPFCLLDEKGDVSKVAPQDLLANGYTQDQVNNILAGQAVVLNYMAAHQMSPASQMPAAFDAVKNSLNPDYLQFVANR